MSEFNDVDVNEGTLPLQDSQEINLQTQFERWMDIKGVSSNCIIEGKISSNIIRELVRDIVDSTKEEGKQTPYDRCFGKSGFSRDSGYSKESFSKICIV